MLSLSLPTGPPKLTNGLCLCVLSRNIPGLQDGLAEFLHLLERDRPPTWAGL